MWIFISLIWMPSAFAGYCHGLEELREKVKICEQNAYYSEAAVICIDRFKTQVDTATGVAAKVMAKGIDNMEQAQQKNQKTTQASYKASQDTLRRLILVGQSSREEVKEYFNEIVFPDDAEMSSGNLEEDLGKSKCFQKNRDVLTIVVKDFDKKLGELNRALRVAQGLKSKSSSYEAGLGASDSKSFRGRGKVTGRGSGGVIFKGYKPQKNDASDISGSEKLNKKQ